MKTKVLSNPEGNSLWRRIHRKRHLTSAVLREPRGSYTDHVEDGKNKVFRSETIALEGICISWLLRKFSIGQRAKSRRGWAIKKADVRT